MCVFLMCLRILKKIIPKTFGPHCVFRFSDFPFEYCAVCEISWKTIVERERSHIAVQYGACALHSEYELPNSFAL